MNTYRDGSEYDDTTAYTEQGCPTINDVRVPEYQRHCKAAEDQERAAKQANIHKEALNSRQTCSQIR